MGHQWDQWINQKVPEKNKKEYTTPQNVGHSESSLQREVHSITGITQEDKKSQINNLSVQLKELKINNKAQREQKEQKNQNHSKNKWHRD